VCVCVYLARVVAHAHLSHARQALQLVLVEDVALLVVGQVPAVVPRLPEQARQQRTGLRLRQDAAARQTRRELPTHVRQKTSAVVSRVVTSSVMDQFEEIPLLGRLLTFQKDVWQILHASFSKFIKLSYSSISLNWYIS